MTTDPLLGDGVPLSINQFAGDGVTTTWEINFAGGYLQTSHVKAYIKSALTDYVVQTVSWIGPSTVQITPAVPVGYTLTIWRDTPKDAPVVDFVDGSIINEVTLDKLAKQSVFASAEMVDRFTNAATDATTALETAVAVEAQFDTLLETVTSIAGDDFTAIAKLDTAGTFAAAMRFTLQSSHDAGILLGTTALGRAEYAKDGKFRTAAAAGSFGSWATPWTDLNFTPANYQTTAAAATAASTAASATTAAIATAAADATAKDTALKVGIALTGGMSLNGTEAFTVQAVAALAIDVTATEVATKSISTNSTFTFTGTPAASKADILTLVLTLSSGAQPTWPAAVSSWVNGIPTWVNGTWLITFITVNGGTSWIGSAGRAF